MSVAKAVFFIAFLGLSVALKFPEWCVQPSTVHVRQNETCASLHTARAVGDSAVALSAMRGEVESAQVLLDLRSWPADLNMSTFLNVTFTDLKLRDGNDSIPNSRLKWWQVGYVFCKHTTRYSDSGGGWRPDPLLDPSGAVWLETGVTTVLWLSVSVPYGIAHGVYKGSTVFSISGHNVETLTQQIDVEMTVWNIDLPLLKDAKFPAIFSFNVKQLNPVYGTASEELKHKFYSLLLDNRVGGDNLYTTTPTDISDASFLASRGTTWLSLYDVYGVASGMHHQQNGVCLNFTDEMVQKVIDILTPVVAEYKTKELLSSMFVYGFDEVDKACEQSLRKIFGAIKSHWSDLRTVAVLNWEGGLPADLPLDVWVLQYEEFNASEAAAWIASGKEQWWYHCIEPSNAQYLNTFIERPLMEARLLFWLACSQSVGGWLYYSVVMWNRYPASSSPISRIDNTSRTDFDPANYIWYPRTDIFANGDGNFVYPGEDGPVPSVRLHNLRDGFEDAELLRMLKLDQAREIIQPLVLSPTNFSLDPMLLETQRSKAAALVAPT